MREPKKITIEEKDLVQMSQQIRDMREVVYKHYDESFCSALYQSLKDCTIYINKCLDDYKKD